MATATTIPEPVRVLAWLVWASALTVMGAAAVGERVGRWVTKTDRRLVVAFALWVLVVLASYVAMVKLVGG